MPFVHRIVSYALWLLIFDFHFSLPSTKVTAILRTHRSQEGGVANPLSSRTWTRLFNCLTGSLPQKCRPSYLTFSLSYCRMNFLKAGKSFFFMSCSQPVGRLGQRGVTRPTADLSLKQGLLFSLPDSPLLGH